MKRVLLIALILSLSSALAGAQSKSKLSAKAARKIITRMAGIELESGAVKVKSVSSPDAATVEAVAVVEEAFRLVKDERGVWRVAEMRTGNNRWEEVEMIARSLGVETSTRACDAKAIAAEGVTGVHGEDKDDPGPALARCLVARLINVESPSDAVRVKELSPLELPFSLQPSALVVAQVLTEFRLTRGAGGKWSVSQMRAGSGQWADVEQITRGVNEQKRERARAELETVAAALEKFRSERGFYVVTKIEGVLVDQLSPRYLARVIRVDPWQKPYEYEGTREGFTLRSKGADGEANTPDDVTITNKKP